MGEKCCGTCKYHEHEDISDGWVCCNSDSEYVADWTDYEHCCEEWERKIMERRKKIYFDCFWNWEHWHLLPAISLDNYANQFDVHFMFMGFWFEIAFIKGEWT